MLVDNKVMVVTGGGSGIGRALVLELLRKGARVAAVDINESSLQETVNLAEKMSERLSTHIADITDRKAVEALPEQVIAEHGPVDGIINNAGIIQPFERVNELEFDAIQRVIDVNFHGTVNVTKNFLPYLLDRPEGHITSISSMGGFLPVPGQTVYGAAKAAIKLFTEGLHSELTDTNVGVLVVFQGATATNIAQNSGITMDLGSDNGEEQRSFKTLTPEEAAEKIIDAIEKDRYQVYVGSDSALMGFLARLNPKFAAKTIFKQMRSLLPA